MNTTTNISRERISWFWKGPGVENPVPSALHIPVSNPIDDERDGPSHCYPQQEHIGDSHHGLNHLFFEVLRVPLVFNAVAPRLPFSRIRSRASGDSFRS